MVKITVQRQLAGVVGLQLLTFSVCNVAPLNAVGASSVGGNPA